MQKPGDVAREADGPSSKDFRRQMQDSADMSADKLADKSVVELGGSLFDRALKASESFDSELSEAEDVSGTEAEDSEDEWARSIARLSKRGTSLSPARLEGSEDAFQTPPESP